MTENNSASTKNSHKNSKVVIVGGGPSGACAAKAMADRGYTNVHIYEGYPHPQTLSKSSSKAYVIALSPRGQRGILQTTGIDLASEKEGVISTHISRHVTSKQKTSSGVREHADTPFVIIPRKVLTERLLDAATGRGVTVHYRHKLVGVDFGCRAATFEAVDDNGTNKTTVKVEYDLLIGADGCKSRVRNLMVENETMLKNFSARIEEDSMEYQVVVLSENPFVNTHPEGTVHSWNHKGRNAICLGFPMNRKDSGDSLSGHSMLFAVVFPEGQLESFRRDGYEAPLTELLPDVCGGSHQTAILRQFETQLRENEIANGGLCVWSSALGVAYHDDSSTSGSGRPCGVVLLGDSGHGMWPSLGQGANCALESVAVFARCLDGLLSDTTNNWTEALIQRFHNTRYEDAVAAVDLTYGGIGARESRGRMNAPRSAQLRMIGTMLLHKLSGGIVPMPALLRILMGDPDISYAQAKRFHFFYETYICLAAGALAVWVGVGIGLRGLPFSSFLSVGKTSLEL